MKSLLFIFLSFLFYIPIIQEEMYEKLRYNMVETQIRDRGIKDEAILRAMQKVPRHLFVARDNMKYAYEDRPLSIGYGQTISQPYIVAYMTECSSPSKHNKALEIGTGSGYQAAVLSEVVDSVYTIEIVHDLAVESAARLKKLGYGNVVVKEGDGYMGWPEHGPFDIILVTAAAEQVPQPLIDQLAEGGRLLMPVGKTYEIQKLMMLQKRMGVINTTSLSYVRFVPLTRETDQ